MESFQMFIYSQGTPSRAPWLNFNGMSPEWEACTLTSLHSRIP